MNYIKHHCALVIFIFLACHCFAQDDWSPNYPASLVDSLYNRFSQVDSFKHSEARVMNLDKKYDTLKQFFSIYINPNFTTMSVARFDDFIEYLRYNKCDSLLAYDDNKRLITDVKISYTNFVKKEKRNHQYSDKHTLNNFNMVQIPYNTDNDYSNDTKTATIVKGIVDGAVFIYDIVAGVVDANN